MFIRHRNGLIKCFIELISCLVLNCLVWTFYRIIAIDCPLVLESVAHLACINSCRTNVEWTQQILSSFWESKGRVILSVFEQALKMRFIEFLAPTSPLARFHRTCPLRRQEHPSIFKFNLVLCIHHIIEICICFFFK